MPLIPFLGPMMFLGPMVGLAISVLWIVFLIDCLRNRWLSGGAKLGWVLLLVFANWVGMILYFLLACSFSPIARKRREAKIHSWPPGARFSWPYRPYQQPYQPLYPPVPPVTPPPYTAPYQPYQPYQAGYQAQSQDRPKTVQFVQDLPVEGEASYEAQYEQPQATYPLMPPQEQ